MRRVLTLPVAVVATALAALAADESPPPGDSDVSFDIEPPLLIPNRSDEPLPASAATTPAPDVDLARLEKDFQRAKRNAAGVERFCKIGALSKVEAERRALRAIRLESDLANARLAQAKAELAAQESQLAAGESTKDELEAAKATLAQLTEAAQIAAAKRERAELAAAEANVHRQEKLLALGSGHKSDVNRAQEKLAELKAPKD